MAANSRSLFHQRMFVKYSRDVPPIMKIASSLLSRISRRARSSLSRRSSTVIGLASLLRDLSSAIDGGRAGDFDSWVCANSGTRAAALDSPASLENSRRVIMSERIISGERCCRFSVIGFRPAAACGDAATTNSAARLQAFFRREGLLFVHLETPKWFVAG